MVILVWPNSGKYLYTLLRLFWGIATGYLFYLASILRLDLPLRLEQYLLPVCLFLYTLVYFFSIQFRAITWLMVPFFASTAGRSYLYLFFFTYAIHEPANNLIRNTYEASRAFTCNMQYNRNVSEQEFKYLYEPYMSIFKSILKGNLNTSTDLSNITDFEGPVDKALSNETFDNFLREKIHKADKLTGGFNRNTLIQKDFKTNNEPKVDASKKKYRAKLAKKYDLNCEALISYSMGVCETRKKEMIDRCYEESNFLTSFMCRRIESEMACEKAAPWEFNQMRSCDGKTATPGNVGTAVEGIDGSKEDIAAELKVSSVKYKVEGIPKFENLSKIDIIEAELVFSHASNLTLFKTGLTLMNRLIALLFVLTVFQANGYHNGYLRKIYLDNCYITKYFKVLDARRVKARRTHLLPLRRLEKTELLPEFSFRLTPGERRTQRLGIFTFIPVFLGSVVIGGFDYIFSDLMVHISTHFNMTRHFIGTQTLRLSYKPDSFIGQALSSIDDGRGINYTIDRAISNEECIPKPTLISSSNYYIVSALNLTLLLYTIFSPHLARTRRLVCAYFYPLREKRRTLHLYNECLLKRKTYTVFELKRIRQLVKEKMEADEIPMLANFRMPKILRLLLCGLCSTRYCSLCESKMTRGSFQCPKCSVLYCIHCWDLVAEVCRACYEEPDEDSLIEESQKFSRLDISRSQQRSVQPSVSPKSSPATSSAPSPAESPAKKRTFKERKK